jgi:hypothetical protein
MNDYLRRNLESGQRCRQWFIDYAALIPAGSIFETKSTAMTVVVGEIEDVAGQQKSAFSEGLSATDVKGSERQDLLDAMEPVRDAARAAEPDHPGTRDRYRYTANMPDQSLLAAGRSFAQGGATDEALLISYGAPAAWPNTIKNACNAFEASFGPQDSAKGQSVALNADLNAKTNEMNALKSQLRHIVKLHTKNNPGAYAAWNTATHVEKAPSKPKLPTP